MKIPKTQYPLVDPFTCLEDPERPGRKLCPRCSKPGKPCCSITAYSPSIFVQVKYLEMDRAGTFPNDEDCRAVEWVCVGNCDPKGLHRDPRG